MIDYKQLASDIRDFLAKYAKLSPNYDPKYDDECEKFNGPDSGMLLYSAEMLEKGLKPDRCWSEYGSGCYTRTEEGRKIHDDLVSKVYKIINGK